MSATPRRTARRLVRNLLDPQFVGMRDPIEATSAAQFPIRRSSRKSLWRFATRAPGPEQPEVRDKAGAQLGMIIILAGGGLFWLGVAAAVVWLLR